MYFFYLIKSKKGTYKWSLPIELSSNGYTRCKPGLKDNCINEKEKFDHDKINLITVPYYEPHKAHIKQTIKYYEEVGTTKYWKPPYNL